MYKFVLGIVTNTDSEKQLFNNDLYNQEYMRLVT